MCFGAEARLSGTGIGHRHRRVEEHAHAHAGVHACMCMLGNWGHVGHGALVLVTCIFCGK